MADNKATALKDATKKPNIKVELFCQGALNGNYPKVIDVTDHFNWDDCTNEEHINFGGIVGYKVSDAYNTGKPDLNVVHLLYDSDDIENIEKKIKQLLQATIVNAKQYAAMEGLVHDIFYEQRSLQCNQLYMFSQSPIDHELGTHLIR